MFDVYHQFKRVLLKNNDSKVIDATISPAMGKSFNTFPE